MDQVVVKTITKTFKNRLQAGMAWFRFILSVNNISCTKRELELLTFINFRGTISSSSSKEEFCKVFGSSPATVNNLTSSLIKKKLLIKSKGKVKLNPVIQLESEKKLVVRYYMNIEEETKEI